MEVSEITTGALLLERDGPIATVMINAAPWNAMGLEFMDELESLVPRLAADHTLRVVLFRGAGEKNFSVGMNLKQLPLGIQAKGGIDELLDQRLRVLDAIEQLGKPTIAVLYGHCLGGGLELPLACHFRLAAEEGTQLGLPELDLGTVPAWGGTARLTRCVGRNHALDIILRGKKISGPEALAIGLVTEVCPHAQLQRRAKELARELSERPPVAVAGVLRCVVGAGEKGLEEALREERRAVHETFATEDQQEGMSAFFEKRKPRFSGR